LEAAASNARHSTMGDCAHPKMNWAMMKKIVWFLSVDA